MRALVQDILRWCIGITLTMLGRLLGIPHRRRIRRYGRDQAALRARYRIGEGTPVLEYGPEQRASIARYVAGRNIPMATTSGSTASPKEIAYPPKRIAAVKWTFMEAFARAYAHLPIERHSFYLYSSLQQDHSLTGMMLEERGLPPYLSCLQAPYRVQQHPAMKALAERNGSAALRLLVLTVANPGVLYSTNPSTLAQFLDDLAERWPQTKALIDLAVTSPESLPGDARRILARIGSRGAQDRLRRIAGSTAALPLTICAPAVEAYICWDGGYVAPFLRRIEAHLPGLRHIPMYSMATEVIETVPDYRDDGVAFLPIAPGVLYELLEEDRPDAPEHLRSPTEAEVGKRYTMVISDAYGLVRYQTGDVFRVERLVDGLPDLRFERRRGLTYSFTGEKLTAQQILLASEQVRAERKGELDGWFFSMIPAIVDEQPHYKLMLIKGQSEIDPIEIGALFDRALGAINDEYRAKRESCRLGPLVPIPIGLEEFATKIASVTPRADWESQLKILPLYPRLFEG